jgi:acyl-CoA-dependent ceramide synthase
VLGLSFNLLALLFLAHTFIPKARPHTYKFFSLSYYNDETGKYGVGIDDGSLIAFFVVLFTGLRAGFIDHILKPLGKGLGLKSAKEALRFSEQAWLILYYGIFWSLGMVRSHYPCLVHLSPYYSLPPRTTYQHSSQTRQGEKSVSPSTMASC